MPPPNRSPLPIRRVLQVEEVRKILGLSRGATYIAIHKGEIPSIRVGGRFLIPVEAFEKFLACEDGENTWPDA